MLQRPLERGGLELAYRLAFLSLYWGLAWVNVSGSALKCFQGWNQPGSPLLH